MTLLQQLQQDFPSINFIEGDLYSWLPSKTEIHYSLPLITYNLLHELGHAIAKHASYKSDIHLLQLEIEAWEQARKIAHQYNMKIPQTYVNKCMDTYRDWLLARSKCPNCNLAGLQSASTLQYKCCNCYLTWKVPAESSCIVRRRKTHQSTSCQQKRLRSPSLK